MLATYLQVPELLLDEKEAKQLSDATARVLSHYPVNIAPQSLDVAQLVMAIGMIYGSRVMAYRVRKSRTAPKPEGGATEKPKVVNIATWVPPGADGTG